MTRYIKTKEAVSSLMEQNMAVVHAEKLSGSGLCRVKEVPLSVGCVHAWIANK